MTGRATAHTVITTTLEVFAAEVNVTTGTDTVDDNDSFKVRIGELKPVIRIVETTQHDVNDTGGDVTLDLGSDAPANDNTGPATTAAPTCSNCGTERTDAPGPATLS